jgi:hypothetical protein
MLPSGQRPVDLILFDSYFGKGKQLPTHWGDGTGAGNTSGSGGGFFDRVVGYGSGSSRYLPIFDTYDKDAGVHYLPSQLGLGLGETGDNNEYGTSTDSHGNNTGDSVESASWAKIKASMAYWIPSLGSPATTGLLCIIHWNSDKDNVINVPSSGTVAPGNFPLTTATIAALATSTYCSPAAT